ncbi:tetrahydrofolate dehydrogenase/cyclohydrolase catalytic domain-containing protein, partial [Aliarcobacter butzleri]|uniref:tetrahydrofolate dehydrogenase/cyclohydrolase catalytic domain-containing protein n=1 Tax=Aliarcobacter butzleri TaxID=28197 RepID=UPI003AF8831C
LLQTIAMMNKTPKLDGILVQLPLPTQIDTTVVLEAIGPLKDVDGFHPYNVGRVVSNHDAFLPATPFGVMRMFEEYGIELRGKNVVVIGSSDIVGKPMASLLINAKATVTECN